MQRRANNPKPFVRSPIAVTAELDAKALTAALERLQRETGKDMAKLVKESARRLAVDLARDRKSVV